MKSRKDIFIIWGREVKLSQYLAEALDARPVQVYYDRWLGLRIPWAIRYVMQTLGTWYELCKSRPKIVYVQNPPVIAPLACLAYCKIFGAELAIDSHTAAFLEDKWTRFNWLFRFVAKRADLNTCHNYKNLEILRDWNVTPIMTLQFFNPCFDESELRKPLLNPRLEAVVEQEAPMVLMVNRFASDDDYLTVIDTAKKTPEMNFFVVGNSDEVTDMPKDLPRNIYLTGYVAHAEFMKLMYRSQVVLAFTRRVDTVLWSIREILALRKPFVTVDSEVMRYYFSDVALFAKSDADEIRKQTIAAMNNKETMRAKTEKFLIKDRERWNSDIQNVKCILHS
jgi:glycosyltransferase involved in cell wall biosynthesis